MSRARTHADRAAAGFTLVELLAAIAIFAVLATMLFRLVKDGLDVWSMGEGRRESAEKGTALLEQIALDLRLIAIVQPPGAPDAPVRLLSDHEPYDFDGDRKEEALVQRLRFVRACPEERFDPELRAAGDQAGSGLPAAPGGLAEVGYALARAPGPGADVATLTLLRWFHAPIGGDESLFSPGAMSDPRGMLASGTPLADRVLYLGFQFWGRDTESFEQQEGASNGPLGCFDSTRALLLDETGPNRFPFAKGKDSLADARDDVFPRRVRVTLVLEKDDDEARRAVLAAAVSETATTIQVGGASSRFAGAAHRFLKIGGEWMEWSDVRGDEVTVRRGVRNTAALPHAAGARVHVGETLVRVVDVPLHREDWNDP